MSAPPFELHVLPGGRTFLHLQTSRLAECVQALQTGNYYGAAFSRYHGYEGDDLEVLGDLPQLRGVFVQDPVKNVHGLRHQSSIEYLALDKIGHALDLAAFGSLQELRLGPWSPRHERLGQCRTLKTLAVSSYRPPGNDLSALAGLEALESLELVRGGISLLRGVELLPKLRELILWYLVKLDDLSPLSGCPALWHLDLNHCRKIRDFEPLSHIATLELLGVNGCGPLHDVKFVTRLRSLRRCAFVETNILDGDLTPFLELPKLEYVGFLPKRHYSHKPKDLDALLRGRTQPP
jgi:hypothetical protein